MAALALGTGLGLWATAFTLSHRLDPAAVRNGPWTTWPGVGTAEIDPYAKAIQAQTGEVPLAAAVGISFVADRDSTGAPLSGRCSYRIGGPVPFARLWTLGLDEVSGRPSDNPASRYEFVSTDILRREDGSFTVDVSRTARPGNWLPAPQGSFVLTLRLYGTSLGATSADLGTAQLPGIVASGCAP